jgi:hypothetical protein
MANKYTASVDENIKYTGYNFPSQKVSDDKKTDKWYKKCIDFAEGLVGSNEYYRGEYGNKSENYNLRANIIDVRNFQKYINPAQLDLDNFPAKFQHVGIGNAKIDLLIGDYISRRREFKAYISGKDEDSNTRKEEMLKEELFKRTLEIIQKSDNAQYIQKEAEKLKQYMTYDFQDLGERTANLILQREYKENNFDFLYRRTFEDLLLSGEQVVQVDILGGKPVMRRIDPRNVFTMGGGSSLYLHEKDIIAIYQYRSVGQIIDDYWDHLSDEDVKKLERRDQYLSDYQSDYYLSNRGDLALLVDNADKIIGDPSSTSDDTIKLISPNVIEKYAFGGDFNENGEIREVTVYWKSRRKIGKLSYIDEYGDEQITYVNEFYKPKEELGESVKWLWVNEWLRGTKIGQDIYVKMQPVEHGSKSMTNLSSGTPPIIGMTCNTNGYKIQSVMDLLKPFDYAYDIGFWKRELEIATFKGTATAVNASLIPSGWNPSEWLQYTAVDKIMFLDPTQEILKGPSQGKSAGAFNTFITQEVSMGANTTGIQMLTDYLAAIEATMGKIAGVQGAREGEIGTRAAVRNVQAEIGQFAKITERWFQLDSEFRRLSLSKFLEACKIAYKDNPQRGSFLLDDLGQQFVQQYTEFSETEFDLHISDSNSDTQLFNDLRQLAQAAIQNGNAQISDLISIYTTNSSQSIARKLKDSSERLAQEQREAQEQQQQTAQQIKQMELQDNQADREFKTVEAQRDRESQERIAEIRAAAMAYRGDSDRDGIPDLLEVEKARQKGQLDAKKLEIEERKVSEKERSNRVNEELKRSQSNVPPKTK